MNNTLEKLKFPSYFEYQKMRLAKVVRVLILLGSLFILGFMAYDYFYFRELFVYSAVIRCLVVFTLALIYWLYNHSNQERYFSLMSVTLTLTSFMLIAYLNIAIKQDQRLLVMITMFFLMSSLSLSALIKKTHLVVGAALIVLFSAILMIKHVPDTKETTVIISHLASVTIFTVVLCLKFINSARETYQIAKKSHDLQLEDSLTGIYNRKGILLWSKETLAETHKDQTFSLIMLDLDHFKKINDQYGHAVGDEVIKKAAQSILDECDAETAVGRLGGEEFLIARIGTSPIEAEKFADNLLNQINNVSFAFSSENSIRVSASLGVSHDQGDSFKKLLIAADRLMYAAKNNGRNQVMTQLKYEKLK